LARLLLIILIAFAIYLLWRGFTRAQVKKDAQPPLARSDAGEDMVKCAHCGVNLPRSEAREEAGRLVCGDNPRCRGPA
jgi:uncharacterized protein